ncbi:MAG: ABC transporter ATP-binding protein [Caldimicrobium sp.]
MQPVLVVQNLSKNFGKNWILKGVFFELYPSEILGIIGPNGAGKSTLLYILLGIIQVSEGEIFYFGKNFIKERQDILRKVGFASNYVSLPFSLTVKENLTIFAHLYEVDEFEEKIDKLLRLFQLKHKEKSLTRGLSSGEMMRLNLVRALLPQPKILLLDEPTAGLDPEFVKSVGEILKEKSQKEGLSVILTSHQLGELEKIATKLLLLSDGRVLDYGKIEDLLKKFNASNLEELYFKAFSQL